VRANSASNQLLTMPTASKLGVVKYCAHSHAVLQLAMRHGWLPGARYTNLRDVRRVSRLGFLDIDWRSYNFRRHLDVVEQTRPMLTVARDITHYRLFDKVMAEALELSRWADRVVVVPKCRRLDDHLLASIPSEFLLGYSVPTRYGRTPLPPSMFRRPVHLLGGRPDSQRRLACHMPVVSLDCNRFTLDAAFGDYFDGDRFRPHPKGGYRRCLVDSLRGINRLWEGYEVHFGDGPWKPTKRVA
jgi:hypothetical protein